MFIWISGDHGVNLAWKKFQILKKHIKISVQIASYLALSTMSKNTSISIGQHFDQFIKHSISEGRYQNASEVVRAGLRLLEDQETKISALRSAISEGLKSGVAHDFEPESFLAQMKSKTPT